MEQYNKSSGYFPEPERVKAILLAAANTSGMEAEGFVTNGNPYRNNYYGSGRVDAYKSLQIINFTSNDSILQSQQKLVYFNITNSNASVVLVWGENSTTYNNLDLIVGNSTNNFTAGTDRNDTVEHVFLRNANNGTWNIYVNGTSVSGPQKFFLASNLNIFSDAYPPKWSANGSYPSSSANYVKNGNYSFNISWTDDVAVDEAVFEWNNITNYSLKRGNFSKYGNVFTANLTDLAVGNYSFKWYANDTSGKWNASDLWNYSVTRAAPNITILLNSSAGNITIVSGDFVNATAYGGEGNISLYRNGSLVNNTLSPIYNVTDYAGDAGTVFNITAFYNRTENFSAQTVTRFITIDNIAPVFSNNISYPASPSPYGSHQFNITWLDGTNISAVFLEWNLTTNYTVSSFSGSGSYNSSREFYYAFSNISIGNYTYRWLANDSMNNWNSTQNFSYRIIQAASRSRLFLNGTENNVTYTVGQIANITALLNVSGKNMTIFANFTGSSEMIASDSASSAYNVTNTSNLNVSSVFNITAGFSGDENYTASPVTYHLGLCPACPSSSGWSSCSGSSQSRTVYICGAPTNYLCLPSTETQSCSSDSSSSGSSGGSSSSGVTVSTLSTNAVVEPTIKVTSSGESTTVSISSVQANSQQVINITNSTVPIKEITFFPSEAATNAKVEMRVASAPTIQKPEGEVFQYISIEKANISFKNSSVIEFFATKEWVSENSINVSTITLNRLSGNWTSLPTSKTGEDSAKIYFKSVTPGFSYFAITGKKLLAQQSQPNTTADSEAKENANEKPDATLLVMGILAIIAAVCFAIYISKKGKNKGDKSEKEKQ